MVNSNYKVSAAFANETKYGSAATVNQNIGIVQSVNPTETNNLIKVRTIGGTRDYNNIIAGKFEISGSMDYLLQGGAFLRMAIGEDTASTATIDSGPRIHSGVSYLHVMGSADSPVVDSFPSFTLELADDEDTGTVANSKNLKRVYTGCRANSASISATIDNPVTVSCDWMAQNVIVGSQNATSVSADISDPYVFYQGAVYATSGNVVSNTSIGTSSMIAEVNSFDVSVNNNMEATWYVSGTTNTYQSTRGPKSIIPKGRDYASNLNLHFKDKNMYTRFLGAKNSTGPQTTLNKYQVVFDLVRSGSIGGVKTATDDFMRIVLGSCAFATENIPTAPEDIVSQTIGVDVKSAKIYVADTDSTYE